MKICARCGQPKPLSEYYKHPKTADGLLGKCKPCHRSDVKANRKAKIDYYRAFDRKRGNRQLAEYQQNYIADHPERRAANIVVGNAVRDGRLIKPEACWSCGSTFHIVGHHPDYSRPLDVCWMCQACHKQLHDEAERLDHPNTREETRQCVN